MIHQGTYGEEGGIPLGQRFPIWLSLLLIVLIGWAVYANALGGAFVWDDQLLVANNPQITSWQYVPDVLRHNLGDVILQDRHSSYRPLQTLTYMADYFLGGHNPVVYHVTNVCLHAAVGCALFWMILSMFGCRIWALITAVLFVVHPVHTEAVSYISGRADPLSALFLILGFTAYIKCSKQWSYYWVLLLCFPLALFARESALLFLPYILVYHYSFQRKLNIPGFMIVIGTAVMYVGLRVSGSIGSMGLTEQVPSTFIERLPGFFVAVTQYLRLLIVPTNLHMEYGRELYAWTNPMAIAGALCTVIMLSVAVRYRKTFPWLTFGIAWFFIGLLPISNTFLIVNAFMAEHWLYVPSIGFVWIAARCIMKILPPERAWIPLMSCLAVVVGMYGGLTIWQNRTWQDPVLFFERTLHYAPNSARAHSDLGIVLAERGQDEEALQAYHRALILNPGFIDGYNNLANLQIKLGRIDDAIRTYQRALSLGAGYEFIHYNLAMAYKEKNDWPAAIKALEQEVGINPGFAPAYQHLSRLFYAEGNLEGALWSLQRLVRLRPDETDGHYALGLLYIETGKDELAKTSLMRVLELERTHVEALNNLGVVASREGRMDEAMVYFLEVLRLDPAHVGAYSNLGVAYNSNGQTLEAIRAHQTAIDLDPHFAGSYNNLAYVYNTIGQHNNAVPLLQTALTLQPEYTAAMNNLAVSLTALGKPDEAQALYQTILRIEPDNQVVQHRLEDLKNHAD